MDSAPALVLHAWKGNLSLPGGVHQVTTPTEGCCREHPLSTSPRNGLRTCFSSPCFPSGCLLAGLEKEAGRTQGYLPPRVAVLRPGGSPPRGCRRRLYCMQLEMLRLHLPALAEGGARCTALLYTAGCSSCCRAVAPRVAPPPTVGAAGSARSVTQQHRMLLQQQHHSLPRRHRLLLTSTEQLDSPPVHASLYPMHASLHPSIQLLLLLHLPPSRARKRKWRLICPRK